MSIDQRIASLLSNSPDAGSAEIDDLVAEVTRAAEDRSQALLVERERMLDPTNADPAKSRDAIDRLEVELARLRAALPQLKARCAQARAAEYAARWEADYERVEQERDKLAEELSVTYPAFVAKLVDLLNRIAEFDKQVDRINSTAPTGDNRRLVGCELRARGLDRFTAADPPLSDLLRLPDWSETSKVFYPPPQPNLLAMAMYEAASAHARRLSVGCSADWWQAKELEGSHKLEEAARREAEIEREKEHRKFEYYQSLRDNAAARARPIAGPEGAASEGKSAVDAIPAVDAA